MCVNRCSKYIYWVKKDLFGCFRIEDKNNETGLKEGGRIEMLTTVLPLRDARSLCFCIYLPLLVNKHTLVDVEQSVQ